MGCETNHPPIVETSLDGIEKLISSGFLTGKKLQQRDKKRPIPLINQIVNTVCNCRHVLGTQLKVTKTLLTIATCDTVSIHADNLKTILFTCYMVHLNTKNFDIQRSSFLLCLLSFFFIF